MAQQDKTTYEGTFNSGSVGLFKDNTTQDIEATDLRTLVTNTKDSFLNKTDEILDEDDMASDSSTAVPTQQSVKAYVDNASLGVVGSWKNPVRVATTVAGTLATSFENGDTVDGVVLATGDRILIKNQASAIDNGIYVVAVSGAPTRSTDADTGAELEGAATLVQEGTTNANTSWVQTTDGVTLGVSNIVFAQMGSSVPDADATTKGIAKLYPSTSLGTNTDGAPDQNAVKAYVDARTLTQILTTNNDAGGLAIENLDDPTNAQDAATKAYVDSTAIGTRVQTVTSASTVTINLDTQDAVVVTAQAAGLTIANPAGTLSDMRIFTIRIKDNGTPRVISYGTQYRVMEITLPVITIASKYLFLQCCVNTVDTKVDVVAVVNEI